MRSRDQILMEEAYKKTYRPKGMLVEEDESKQLSREERIEVLKRGSMPRAYNVKVYAVVEYTTPGDETKFSISNYKVLLPFKDNITSSSPSKAFEDYKKDIIGSLNEYLEELGDKVYSFDYSGTVHYNDAEDTYLFILPFYTQSEHDIADREGWEDIETESHLFVAISREDIDEEVLTKNPWLYRDSLPYKRDYAIPNTLTEDLSREERIAVLKDVKTLCTYTYDMLTQEDKNRVMDLVRNICDVDVDDRGSILRNCAPVVRKIEEGDDQHSGEYSTQLTLPLRNIHAESIKSIVLKRQEQRWPGYEDIDVYEDVLDPEVLEIEPIDYYSRAVNFERGTHLIEFEDLGNGTGRFTIEQSWYDPF